jgi:tetratricopeptide (TPR) repeat protein
LGLTVSVRAKIFSITVLSMLGAGLWPAASSAQQDYGVASYMMNLHNGGNGAQGPGGEQAQRYSATQEYQQGLEAFRAGKIHEAERDFDHAVNADRKSPEMLTMRGVARSRLDDLGGAANDLQKSLTMDPTQITALREYGVVLARQGKTDKAKAQLGLLKLQAEGCGDSCPDAATLKDATAAVQDAIAQPGAHS